MTAQLVSRWLRYITPVGWIIFVLTVLGALAATLFGWIEGGALAVTGAVLIATAVPFLRGAGAYFAHLKLPSTSAVVGGTLETEVTVANTSGHRQPGSFVDVRVGDEVHRITVPTLAGQASHTQLFAVAAERRGVLMVGPVTLRRSDPLGLFRSETSWADQFEVCVHPRTVLLPPVTAGFIRDLSGLASSKLTDSDLSFHAVREYAQGDAMRHIHWKSTAKHGTLMVRQYEESQSSSIAVLFDANVSAYESVAALELGLSAAASISVQAVRDGRKPFVVRTHPAPVRRKKRESFEHLAAQTVAGVLNSWSHLEAETDGQAVVTLVRQYAASTHSHALVVIVSGALLSTGEIRRAAAALASTTHVLLIRAVPLAEPQLRRVGQLTVVTIGTLDDLPGLFLRSRS